MPITRYEPANDLQAERLERLRALYPEAFADGQLDWDALRDLLGAPMDEGEEYNTYGLFWPGKRAARRAAAIPPRDALAPAPGEGVDEETTHNVFIEGDNLEVLKLLRKAYAGRVKLIYIDPPYNTGNDFIYRDDFSEGEEDYLQRTGQVDDLGRRLTTNTRGSGRYHANWLDMMYPRLAVAKELLRQDGVIFISIGDDECANLRGLCDEIFGGENCLGCVARVAKKTSNKGTYFAPSKDYVLVYASSYDCVSAFMDDVDEEYTSRFRERDARGLYATVGLYQAALDPLRGCSNQRYWIACPDGSYAIPPGDIFPPQVADAAAVPPKSQKDKVWRWSYSSYLQKKDLLVFKQTPRSPLLNPDGGQSTWNVYTKYYLSDRLDDGIRPRDYLDTLTNDLGTAALKNLDLDNCFDFAKPPELVARLSQWLADDEGLYLDFFAGSCTTAHAILGMNREDQGRRTFLMVQLPEAVRPGSYAEQMGFQSIAEIGKERIRRVIARMKAEGAPKDRETPEDLGFRVFKQGPSNFRHWRDYVGQSVDEYQAQLAGFESLLVEGWSPVGLRTEVMLAQGFPLDSAVTRCAALPHNTVEIISHAWCEHRLWICLDERIAPETESALTAPECGFGPQDVFVCLDSALTDEARAWLGDALPNVVVI